MKSFFSPYCILVIYSLNKKKFQHKTFTVNLKPAITKETQLINWKNGPFVEDFNDSQASQNKGEEETPGH